MKRTVGILLSTVAFLSFALAQESQTQAPQVTALRVAHLAPNAQEVDVLVDGEVAFTGVGAGTVTGYRLLYLDELSAGTGPSTMRLLALVESARGLNKVKEIAAASLRVHALIPGNEDLATDLGIRPEPERMLHAFLPVLLAARAQGIRVYGTLGGSADFRDLEGYRERVKLSKAWGFSGTTCIHPSQVQVINEIYEPEEAELQEAERIVEIFEASGGNPVALEGKMVDRPVYLRAKRMLEQADEP